MRRYIFTSSERRRLVSWLTDDEEDDTTRMIFVAVRRNLNHLSNDLELLTLVARKLTVEKRWMGRTRLPKAISQKLKAFKNLNRALRQKTQQ